MKVLTFLVAFLVAAPVWAEPVFIEGLGDVPLMPGLDVDEGETMIFDSASGRIADIAAVGTDGSDLDGRKVQTFYRTTLPQLGWQVGAAPGTFKRDGEALRVTTMRLDTGQFMVRFRLTPGP